MAIIILRSYHGLVAFFGLFAVVATMFMRLNPPIGLLIFLVGYGIWLLRKGRER